jgi:PhnB protein
MARKVTATPYLTVRGGKEAIAFYKKAFGAKQHMLMMAEDKKRVMHASLTIDGAPVMLSDSFEEYSPPGGPKAPGDVGGASMTVHLEVPDSDKVWNKAVKAGATVVMPLEDQFWGQRFGMLGDPFGHSWSIGGPLRKKAATAGRKAAKKKKT